MPAQAQGKTIVTTILNAINSHIPEQLGITQKANHLHFNIHDNHQIVLLRHFYSALIRATYLKYMFDERPFDQKLKTVLSMCNAAKPQFKRGRGNKSMQSRLESSFIQKENQQLYEQNKKRMTEYKMIDDFINDNEVKLKPIFLHLYMKSSQGKIFNYDDMTVTYDYFYQKIIRKSSLLISKTFFLTAKKTKNLFNLESGLQKVHKSSFEAKYFLKFIISSTLLHS